MAACGCYWNASLSLSSDPMERQLLKEPLTELIDLCTSQVSTHSYDALSQFDLN